MTWTSGPPAFTFHGLGLITRQVYEMPGIEFGASRMLDTCSASWAAPWPLLLWLLVLVLFKETCLDVCLRLASASSDPLVQPPGLLVLSWPQCAQQMKKWRLPTILLTQILEFLGLFFFHSQLFRIACFSARVIWVFFICLFIWFSFFLLLISLQ